MVIYVISAFDFINSSSASAKRIKNVSSLFKGEVVYMPYSGPMRIFSIVKYLKVLRKHLLQNSRSIFYYYPTTNPIFEIIWYIFVVKYNFVVYYDLNEKRTVLGRLNRFDAKSIKIFLLSAIKLPVFLLLEKAYPINEKLIVISRSLESKFKKSCSCILVPALVSVPSEIRYPTEKKFKAKLGYFGTITLYKEDFLTIFKTLSILNSKGVRFHIDIYGEIVRDSLEFDRLQRIYNVYEQVTFHPFVNNQKAILDAMRNVDILLLIRRNNAQNRYGFSTKLVEYFLSGTPVIATDVSDNAYYIKHAKNGFLLHNYDSNKLAELLLRINSGDYNLLSIGTEGVNTALEFFDKKKYYNLLDT